MKHSIDVVRKAVAFLNPGQTPIICMDQPLYTLAKQIQWNWPETYGEDKLVVMFGPLHIEMGALRLLGELMEDSGWVGALVQANVASSGTAESFLKASHVGKTRRAHQVTACCLYILLQTAYQHYKDNLVNENTLLSYQAWLDNRCLESSQFMFWHKVLSLELLVLTFVKSVRQANFPLYVDSLTKLVPWCFALNHGNYARWLPVHIRDMSSLPEVHPDVFREFSDGKFVVLKTNRPFSAIGIDHAHEQANALVKGDGGAVGLTEDPGCLLALK